MQRWKCKQMLNEMLTETYYLFCEKYMLFVILSYSIVSKLELQKSISIEYDLENSVDCKMLHYILITFANMTPNFPFSCLWV